MKIRISGIHKESILDGLGLRYVIFAQGCPHNCYQCHNPSTHCFSGGELRDTEDILEEIFRNPLLKGVTFSGGEPFEQAEAFLEIAQKIKFREKNKVGRKKPMDIWCYTGYRYEELQQSIHSSKKDLLKEIDVLVDGKFIFEKKTIEKPFVGSSNQRVIDVKNSQPECLSELKFFS